MEPSTVCGQQAIWGQLIAAHPEHADALLKIADSTATTRALPATVAVAVLNALEPTIATPAELDALTDGDTRHTVTTARNNVARVLNTGDNAADLARTLCRGSSRDNRRLLLNARPSLARAAIELLATRTGADRSILDVIHAISGLYSGDEIPLTTTEPANPDARAIIVLAASATLDVHPVDSAATLDDALAAAELLAELQPAADFNLDDANVALACVAWRNGGTLDDIATTLGCDPSTVDDTTVDAFLSAWGNHIDITGSPERPLDDLLDAFSANGTRDRPSTYSPIPLASDTYPIDRIAAYHANNSYACDVNERFLQRCADGDTPWDAEHVTAALAAHPTFARLLHDHLHEHTPKSTPDWLVEANAVERGLETWISAGRLTDRLAQAGNAAKFDAAHWALLWRHLTDFRGTPEQLVDVIDAIG
jgi:hypothetical protein